MEISIGLSLQIEGVISVGLFALTSVDNLSSVSVEDSPFTITKSETGVESLAKSICIVTVDFSTNLDEIV